MRFLFFFIGQILKGGGKIGVDKELLKRLIDYITIERETMIMREELNEEKAMIMRKELNEEKAMVVREELNDNK